MKSDITTTTSGGRFKEKILSGVDLAGETVGSTMGPFGRNVIIERKVHPVPIITNDGKRVIKAINPKDPIERLAVRTLEDAAARTDSSAGDGTTGTIVLAQAIIHSAFKEIDKNAPSFGLKMVGNKQVSVVQLRKDINEAKDKVLKALEKSRKKISTLEELQKVAYTSVEDRELGDIIASMVKKVGTDGHIFVEEGFNPETETEVIEGMKFYAKLAANFMITDPNRMETSVEKVPCVVTNLTVKNINQFAREGGHWIVNDLMAEGETAMVIFAWKYEKEFLYQVADLWKKTGFKLICVKVPAILTEQLKDLAIYLGASLVDENMNVKLSQVSREDLGRAKKISVNSEECVIVGGNGKKVEIDKRIEEIRQQIKVQKIVEYRPKLEQRIADLSSGIGIVRIGNNTQSEQLYVLDKVQDAVLATKMAMKDGVVRGGGLALKEIAKKLPENILTEPLKSTYRRIQENAGGMLEIGDEVIDPYAVIKSQVENACSVAGTLITASTGIYDAPEALDELKGEIVALADKITQKPMPVDPDGPDER